MWSSTRGLWRLLSNGFIGTGCGLILQNKERAAREFHIRLRGEQIGYPVFVVNDAEILEWDWLGSQAWLRSIARILR